MDSVLRPSRYSLPFLALILLGLPAGCGGSGEGGQETTGLRPEETFWDDAQSMPKVQGTTRYGKFVGEYSEFHRNGQVARRGAYSDDGLENGVWRAWHPDGRALSEVAYAAGHMQGGYK